MNIDKQVYLVWKENLDKIREELRGIAASTEKEFLSIGNDLNNFYSCTRDISDMSSSLISSISETQTSMKNSDLGNLLNRMNSCMKESETGFKSAIIMLDLISNSIESIYKPIEQFRKIVKKLRIFSVSTKIENAHLNDKEISFIAISHDVDNLATLVQSSFTGILSSAELLKGSVKLAHERVLYLETEQNANLKVILDKIRAAMLLLSQKNSSTSDKAHKISAGIQLISTNMGEVVASMQFHDITRQQIEHVEEALNTISDKLTGENTDEMRLVKETGVVCDIQIAQLTNAREKFSFAVNSIIDNIAGISDNTVNLCEDVKILAGIENETSESYFSQIEQEVSAMIRSLEGADNAIRDLSANMDIVINKVGGMSIFVQDIEEISTEIELIALNARIKAAHTGTEGAPLGVIAEAIQKLSGNVRVQKKEISNELQNIICNAENLHKNISRTMETQTAEMSDILTDFNTLTEKLHFSNVTIMSLLKKIEKEGMDLTENINNTLSNMHVDGYFMKQVNSACNALGSIVSEIREIVPAIDLEKHMEDMEYIEDNYTMQSERKIHDFSLKRNESKSEQSSPSFKYIKPLEEDLGENIELF